MAKFCIPVLPYMKSATQTYLRESFIEKFDGHIPERVRFLVENGDVFEGYFWSSKTCFFGLRNLLKRFGLDNVALLCFEYVNDGNFYVNVIGPAAVQIEYPRTPLYKFRHLPKIANIPDFDCFDAVVPFSTKDKLKSALMDYNANCRGKLNIEISMPQQEYLGKSDCVLLDDIDESITNDWEDGCNIFLKVGNEAYTVAVRPLEDGWNICDGWSIFAEVVGLTNNDCIILSSDRNHFIFDAIVFSGYAEAPTCAEDGVGVPRLFVKLVTEELIQCGSLFIPRIFWEKYSQTLESDVEVVAPSRVPYHCTYSESEHTICGLQKFVSENPLEIGFTLLFEKHSNQKLLVTIFDNDFVDINLA